MLRALPLFAIGTMLAAGCALAACSSDDTFEELHAFTDSASRSCEAQLVKTSPTVKFKHVTPDWATNSSTMWQPF